MDALGLKLLLAELTFQVGDVLATLDDLTILPVDLVAQLFDLLIEAGLVGNPAILEVLDDVQLVLLQHIVVRVQLLIFLL